MTYPLDDTIVAVASPQGGAARGILRLSGPKVLDCLESRFVPDEPLNLAAVTTPTATPGSLAIRDFPARLPCELYLWPSNRSYTGQPAAELHTIGSPPLLDAALRELCLAGARLAQPGEFTLRTFLAGRLDLTQAEAVLGVIDAANSRQLHVALAQLAGGLAAPLRSLRDTLLDLLAHLEAGFDFADEDLTFIDPGELDRQLASAAETVDRLLAQMQSRAEVAEQTRVAIVGWPNTGKSSLFNALSASNALVSAHPGTTRDYLTAELDLGGVKCLLIDTAGVETEPHDTDTAIRLAAQGATSEQQRQAQVRLLCLDASRPLNAWERSQLASDADWLVVLTKADRPRATDLDRSAVATSSATGEGLGQLRERIAEVVVQVRGTGEVVSGTAARCRESLDLAAQSLRRARLIHESGWDEELVAVEVRAALQELGKVVGAVYTEDLLDRIFSRFCIGK